MPRYVTLAHSSTFLFSDSSRMDVLCNFPNAIFLRVLVFAVSNIQCDVTNGRPADPPFLDFQ